MTKQYDLVVISTGAAAMVAATRVHVAGWQVAVIDCFQQFTYQKCFKSCN